MKNARRRAREIALQALYAWQIAGGGASDVIEHARSLEGWERCDAALAEALMRGVVNRAAELETVLAPCLDARSFAELSPVERAVLYIGSYELAAHPETPFKVVLNEAIELGKSFGGTDGHRFINGVLEKLAGSLREQELARHRRSA
ncbi:MAG: transcription antitermination factor NusB [Betaproteobacteria bacterium]|nr:transcription antitermination factor NusB [Betaproteobacteria bacterium]